jgi:two-component system response regulator HydG
MKKEIIVNALAKTQNNKSEAAKLLKITRKTLYNKIKLYNIN